MKASGLVLTAVIVGAVWGAGHAAAADLGGTPTRNWGGFWLGFGAGYARSSDGQLGSNVCGTYASGSAEASCDASGGRVETNASASSPTMAAATAAGAASDGRNSTAATALAIGSGTGAEANASVSVNPLSGTAAASQSGAFGFSLSDVVAATDGANAWTYMGGGVGSGSDFGSGSSTAFSEPSRGIVGSVSRAEVAGSAGSGEAIAIGIAGLSSPDMSGGLAGNINMRYDHQAGEHWIFGAEVDFTGMPESVLRSQSSVGVADFLSIGIGRSMEVQTLLASARLRLGYAFGDYMIYGTGGAAYAHSDATYTETIQSEDFSEYTLSRSKSKSLTSFGGVIGGGLSVFLSDNSAVSLEGLYYVFAD